jgi:hypothetical protein
MSTFQTRRAMTLVILFGLCGCDRKSAPTNEPMSSHDADPAVLAAPPVDTGKSVAPSTRDTNPIRPIDAGLPDWYKCKVPQDCVVVSAGRCCAPCDPIQFVGYSAVNVAHKDDFMAYQGCANATCPCPSRVQNVPFSDANFFALCQQHRCVAVDLRYSQYAQCQSSADCALRRGLGCCEGCGDAELVTYNPKSTLLADICPVKRKCPPATPECRAMRNPSAAGECAAGYCQLADY